MLCYGEIGNNDNFHTMLAKLVLGFATPSVGQVTGKLDHFPPKSVSDTAIISLPRKRMAQYLSLRRL